MNFIFNNKEFNNITFDNVDNLLKEVTEDIVFFDDICCEICKGCDQCNMPTCAYMSYEDLKEDFIWVLKDGLFKVGDEFYFDDKAVYRGED